MYKKITSWKAAKKIRRRQKKVNIIKKGLKIACKIALYGVTLVSLWILMVMFLAL